MTAFAKKIAVVTGASRGIGKAIALELADAGAQVACLATRAENAEDIVAEIQSKGEQLIRQDGQLQKIKKIGLNKRQEKAIKRLIIKGTLSVNEYQSVALCIRRTAQRDLEELIEKKVVKVVAKSPTDPTKHYVLL